MENFVAHNPTRLHFGSGVLEELGQVAAAFGRKAMLVYGKGSVVRNGYHKMVLDHLKNEGVEVFEYSGIKPNPVVEDVDRAAEMGKKESVDVVVALGGGSVIDSAKIIANCISNDCTAWQIMKREVVPGPSVPLIAILTLAATGTEMNSVSVLQNHQTGEKIGFSHPVNFPKHSFLDPDLTKSVPPDYTAYGVVDLVAHCLEAYFGKGEATLSDRFVYAIVQEAFEVGPLVLKEPENYDYRARVMWAATNALNGLTGFGRESGDWGVHAMGHTLSYLYDTAHGASLSISYPAWLKLHRERAGERIANLGKNLFGTSDIDETIKRLTVFFTSLGAPVHLSEIGIDNGKKQEIIALMNKNRVRGFHHNLTREDHTALVNYMM